MSKAIFPPSIKAGIPRLGGCPKNWQKLLFGDVWYEITRPVKLESDKVYQLVTVKRNRGGVVPREKLKGRQVLTKTQFFVESGDFLISKRQIVHGACGVVPYYLNGAIVSNEYAVLHAKAVAYLPFLTYFSSTVYFQQTCFHASVGVTVEKMIFKLQKWFKYKINLPPLPEQKKIAEILSCWDEAIEKTEKLIEAKVKLKRGLMHYLLGERLTGDGVLLKSVVTNFIVPMRDKPKAFGGDIPWCRIEDFNGRYLSDSQSKQYVSRETVDQMNLKIFPVGTVLCSCSARLGVCSIVKKELVTNQTFIGLVCGSKLNPEFFYYYLISRSRRLQDLSSGTTISYLSRKQFENFKITLPSLDQQNEIAKILNNLEAEIIILNSKLNKLTNSKSALMQNLLTGKTRVKI